MKILGFVAAALLLAGAVASPAFAGSAASDWGADSMSYTSPNEDANAFNKAFMINRLREGYYAPPVTYSTQNCQAQNSCATQQNMSGVTQTNISNSNNVHVDTSSVSDAKQSNTQQGVNGKSADGIITIH